MLQGGWRLAPEVAFTEMLKTPALGHTNVQVEAHRRYQELKEFLDGTRANLPERHRRGGG